MTKAREKAIKLYWKIAKERCPFQEEEMVNSFLEGFIDCAEYLLLQNTDLEKENANLTERLLKVENAYKRKSEAEWHLNDLYEKVLTDFANAEKCSREYFTRYRAMIDRYAKAEELLKWFVWYFKEGCLNLVPYTHKVEEVEQFIKDLEK